MACVFRPAALETTNGLVAFKVDNIAGKSSNMMLGLGLGDSTGFQVWNTRTLNPRLSDPLTGLNRIDDAIFTLNPKP